MAFSDIFKTQEYKKHIETLIADLNRQHTELNLQKEAYVKLLEHNQFLANKLNEIGAERYDEVTSKINELNSQFQLLEGRYNITVTEYNAQIESLQNRIKIAQLDCERESLNYRTLREKSEKQDKRILKSAEIQRSIDYSLKAFVSGYYRDNVILTNDLDELYPSVTLRLHHMDSKALRQAFRDNDRQINKVLKAYEGRYTTKANKAIYNLMVIALRSELQNILYNLKYDKLEASIKSIKLLTGKYLVVAEEGNQTIASTLEKFIGEIEYLFINAAKIEYNYYVKVEQAKQERLAIRQQMREEAEERKALEKEKSRIQAEEEKYAQEILRNQELIKEANNNEELLIIQNRILELEQQLSDVLLKKDEIVRLQHGKAGTVYIISNKGAFGENVFKIGMTRRMDPMDRINELGSASVPFRFDIHSMIFSNDAVSLEVQLHSRLHQRRINKVNMRKEFFNCTLEELENIVSEIDPTAEFITVMPAEEYNQSLSTEEVYDIQVSDDDFLDNNDNSEEDEE